MKNSFGASLSALLEPKLQNSWLILAPGLDQAVAGRLWRRLFMPVRDRTYAVYGAIWRTIGEEKS